MCEVANEFQRSDDAQASAGGQRRIPVGMIRGDYPVWLRFDRRDNRRQVVKMTKYREQMG